MIRICLILLILCACSAERSSKTRVRFDITGKPSRLPTENTDWGLSSSATDIADFNCFGVMIRYPELPPINFCQNEAGITIVEPDDMVGTAAVGASLNAEVLNGAAREFYVFGFKSTIDANSDGVYECPNVNANMDSLEQFLSPPSLLGTSISDVNPSTSSVGLVASIANKNEFDDCTGPLFDPFGQGGPAGPSFYYDQQNLYTYNGATNISLTPIIQNLPGGVTFSELVANELNTDTGLVFNADGTITGTVTTCATPIIKSYVFTVTNGIKSASTVVRVLCAAAASDYFYVNSSADDGDLTLDGTCLAASGGCTLRAAIEENMNMTPQKHIIINNNVRVFWSGTSYTLSNDNVLNFLIGGKDAYSSVIDGSNATPATTPMFTMTDSTTSTMNLWFNALTIQNVTSNTTDGSAIQAGTTMTTDFVLDLFDMHFLNNKANSKGGAIHFAGNTAGMKIRSSLFANNEAGQGGALSYVATSATNPLQISNSIFRDNRATGVATLGSGGAVFIGAAAEVQSLSKSVFEFNSSQLDKGGAWFDNGSATNYTISNTIFIHNTAELGGGHIAYETGGGFNIVHSTFFAGRGHTSGTGGAIYNNSGSNINLKNTVFENNTAGPVNALTPNDCNTGGMFVENAASGTANATDVSPNLCGITNTYDAGFKLTPPFGVEAYLGNFGWTLLRPILGSNADDQATDPACSSGSTDIMGNTRGATCDLGALEN